MSKVLHSLLLLVICQVAMSSLFYDEPRLPLFVVPFHYDLTLITHLENVSDFHYEGTVKISLYVQRPTNQVVLHVGGIGVDTRNISLLREEDVWLNKVYFNHIRQYMVLNFNRRLMMGRTYVLSIRFGRELSEFTTDGYFIGRFANARTWQKNWYSMTFFERNLIRNTMPCFDEPNLRATFNVTMGHHKRFQSFSNMRVLAILPNPDLPDYVWSLHEVTPSIPTHMLAFSVNSFTCSFSQSVSSSPLHFRTCSRPGDLPETSLVAYVAPQLLQFFEELLGVRLPLDKIDQLVVDRIPATSLESLGFVVYRSREILQLNEAPISQAKIQAFQVIAQGIAHMWFGNLMGINSWSDLWLTEGLSNYFEALGVDHLQPGVGRRQLLRYREMAFMYEAQVGGITLAPPVEIEPTAYETALFQKASALLVMLNGFLGNETFYDGIQRHLWQNSFTGSTPDIFWRSLQLARERQPSSPSNEESVKTVMDTWTQQRGYPLLKVSRNGTTVFLTQSHVFNESRPERWWIPITFATQAKPNFNDVKPKVWMSPFEEQIQLNVTVPENQWIVFNLHALGYYRVQYDEHTWELLADTLYDDFRKIHVLSRAQIVSDVLFLHKHKRLNWGTVLNVLKYIVDEDEQEPLMAFVLGLTNGYWGFKPENSMSIAKWLGIAGKWYAEFIVHTFDKFVFKGIQNSLV